MKVKALTLVAIISLGLFVYASDVIDCANLKYKELNVSEVALIAKMHKRDPTSKGIEFSAAEYPEKYNKLCSQIKCLMRRDRLLYQQMKDKYLKSSSLPPMGKQMVSDAMTELDLETCSK